MTDVYDITSQATIMSYTNDGDEILLLQGVVILGDGTDDLDGTGGEFELTFMFGSNTNQPDPQIIYFSTATRASVFTEQFPLAINETVTFKIKSPNAADTSVYIHCTLYEVGVESIRDDLLSILVESRVVTNVYDTTGGATGSGSGVVPSTLGASTGIYPGHC